MQLSELNNSAMAYMPGTASLIEEIDKRLIVVLRDGRTLIGILRSIDQFANLVLEDTIERIHVGKIFGDIPRGIFLVRGENVVLLGDVDENRMYGKLERVGVQSILHAQEEHLKKVHEKEEAIRKAMIDSNLIPPPKNSLLEEF